MILRNEPDTAYSHQYALYLVILSGAKNLAFRVLEILRCAQDDKIKLPLSE